MKKGNLRIGNLGEDIAVEHLKEKGYYVVERNHRNKYSEMDLIALDRKKNLIFIEVRTKTNQQSSSPEESINRKKISRLIRSAEAYIANVDYKGLARIDAVCIVLREDESPEHIAHYENISQSQGTVL